MIPAWRQDGFKSKFENEEIKLLYSQYFFKQKMEMVVQLLIVLAINTFILIILYFAHQKTWYHLLILVLVFFFICIVALIKLCNTRTYSMRNLTIVSLGIWLLQVLLLFMLVVITPPEQRTPSDHTALVVFITFVTYTMLPLSLLNTVLLGIIIAFLHCLIFSLVANRGTESLYRQVSYIIIYELSYHIRDFSISYIVTYK